MTPTDTAKRLIWTMLAGAVLTFLVAAFYPLGRPVDETMSLSFSASYAWVAAQSILLSAAVASIMMLVACWFPKSATIVGTMLILAVPASVFLDCLTFHRIGERLFSVTTGHIAWTLLPGLMPFIGWSTLVIALGLTLALIGLIVMVYRSAGWISVRWSTQKQGDLSPPTVLAVVVVAGILISVPAMLNLHETLVAMKDHSTRHPLCTFRLVGYRSTGIALPTGDQAIRSSLDGLNLAPSVFERLQRIREVGCSNAAGDRSSSDAKPDIVILIVESLRPDMLNAEVMPAAFGMSNKSLSLANHFSGGNASNLGIFSLINGLEATWFPCAEKFDPIMNRVLHQLDYEIGFYGGSEGWDHFQMEGYIHEKFYDDFQIEPVDWNKSDRRAVERASQFLEPNEQRRPRCAVVYLYSTHAPYVADPEHQVFTPVAQEWNVSLFTGAGRPLVINRYKNAAHFIDALIAPLMREDRIVVLVGDHGESLLDDGTIGHGTRMSKIQMQTPAFIHVPGNAPESIEYPTSHIDVLPTLVGVLGGTLSDPEVVDGVDLSATSDLEIAARIFASCAYMANEVLLIGPWTGDPAQPLGYRDLFSIDPMAVFPMGPVDDQGLQWAADRENEVSEESKNLVILRTWIKARFSVDPLDGNASNLELFQRHFSSPHAETRMVALELAGRVKEPEPALITMVAQMGFDEDAAVRAAARESLIVLQRRRRE